MRQVLATRNGIETIKVPFPSLGENQILVETYWSCISAGTEIENSGKSEPLWKAAVKNPDKVAAVLKRVFKDGPRKIKSDIERASSWVSARGYSLSGKVLKVGDKVKTLKAGDRVACGGVSWANHADYAVVPENLAVKVPSNVSLRQAAATTIGAIALQGVRRAEPTLGESFLVLGLGFIGQLVVQLLKANGCIVYGKDLDPRRVETAKKNGMDYVYPGSPEALQLMTAGYGVDGVIIAAASRSDEIVSEAFKCCRPKGRVVLVGDVGLNLRRADFYKKEIDFRISTSYGPGRYDPRYEEDCLDYPIGYVRWTERRNMEAFLTLVSKGKVDIDSLLSRSVEVAEAKKGYQMLSSKERPFTVLLRYEKREREPLRFPPARKSKKPIVMGVIGAGGFVSSKHLPFFSLRKDVELAAVVNKTSASACSAAYKFRFSAYGTKPEEILKDPAINTVLIGTRHNLHGPLTIEALEAGKNVFVEKPLACTEEEVSKIVDVLSSRTEMPILFTGFNRRFSPYTQKLKELMQGRPAQIVYEVNAGFIPKSHWVHGPEGCGRNIGEACHFYDFFLYLTQSRPRKISVSSLAASHALGTRDSFSVLIEFLDGSSAVLVYSSVGNREYPKETVKVYANGLTAVMTDFRKLEVYGDPSLNFETAEQDKGLEAEFLAFLEAIKTGKQNFPIEEQLLATQIALEVERLLGA